MAKRHKIGLGTVQFGLTYGIGNKDGQTKVDEVTKILKSANTYGIKVLDSASAYGNAEEVLGKNDLERFQVVSKFMPPIDESIQIQFEKSLHSLGLKKLYGYLAHRPESILENPVQWIELQNLKKEGKVQRIGFSLNEPEELNRLLERGYIPDIVQAPYNYFDDRFEESFRYLKNIGCEVHTRSAFLQGLFFMEPDSLSSYFDEIKDNLKKLQVLEENLSVSLLNFVLNKSFIDKVIIGVENNKQLIQNVGSLNNAVDLPVLNKIIPKHILNPSLWKN